MVKKSEGFWLIPMIRDSDKNNVAEYLFEDLMVSKMLRQQLILNRELSSPSNGGKDWLLMNSTYYTLWNHGPANSSRIIHTLKLGKISVRTHWCKLSQIPLSQVNSARHKDKKREEVIGRSHPFVYTLHFSAFLITVLPWKAVPMWGFQIIQLLVLIFHSSRTLCYLHLVWFFH